MSKKKKIGFGILGTVVALVIIALVAPSPSAPPSEEVTPGGGKAVPPQEEATGAITTPPMTVEIGEGEPDISGSNLSIRLECDSDEGVYVHNMVLRSDSAEDTVYVGTVLSRRGASTFYVYLPYQTPHIEVILQGHNEEILFHETLPAPTSPPTPQLESALVTKNASEIALHIEDFPQDQKGWSQTELSAISMFHEGAESVYGVKFYREIVTPELAIHQQYIFNEVAVFPSVELAQQAYDEIESAQICNASDPHIGDESCYYIGVGQSITFRKANVVVHIRLTFMGDIKSYAETCEERIW